MGVNRPKAWRKRPEFKHYADGKYTKEDVARHTIVIG